MFDTCGNAQSHVSNIDVHKFDLCTREARAHASTPEPHHIFARRAGAVDLRSLVHTHTHIRECANVRALTGTHKYMRHFITTSSPYVMLHKHIHLLCVRARVHARVYVCV